MTGRSLAKINNARRAVATARTDLMQAKSTDEVIDVRSRMEVIRTYAKQVNDRTLEIGAAEIRIRTERLLGEMIAKQGAAGLLAKGTAGKGRPKKGGSRKDPPKHVPTLADVGIDKHLADRARKLAALSEEEFEGFMTNWREAMEKAQSRVTTDLMQAALKAAAQTPKERRASREREEFQAEMDASDALFDLDGPPPERYMTVQQWYERMLLENPSSPRLPKTVDSMCKIVADALCRFRALEYSRKDEQGVAFKFLQILRLMEDRTERLNKAVYVDKHGPSKSEVE